MAGCLLRSPSSFEVVVPAPKSHEFSPGRHGRSQNSPHKEAQLLHGQRGQTALVGEHVDRHVQAD